MSLFNRLFPGGLWGEEAEREPTRTRAAIKATGIFTPVDGGRSGRAPVSRGRVTGSAPVDGGRRRPATRRR